MSKSKHDQIAEKIAKKLGTEYKPHEGIDIVTRNKAVEVETKRDSLGHGVNQIIRSEKARYLAVNTPNIKNALKIAQSTGVGVMGPTGRIIKKAARKG